MELPKLNFNSPYNLKIRQGKDSFFIYDILRKSWFLLTPEEWVRQHWVHYLLEDRGYSSTAIIVEKKLIINKLIKRLDLLVTEKTEPKILIECKAPHIKLTEKTFEQIARYNSVLKAEIIVLSNGLRHIIAKYQNGEYCFIKEL